MGVDMKLYNADWIECNWTVTPTESEITQQQYPVYKRESTHFITTILVEKLIDVS